MKKAHGQALGTTYHISYESPKQIPINSVFDTINASMSTYRDDSTISKINRGDSDIEIDGHFLKVFNTAKKVWQYTDGYFDPTVGSLVNAWGFGKGHNEKMLSKKSVDSLLKFTGFGKTHCDDSGYIQKQNPNIKLDFSALAKGYTVDLVGKLLERHGVKNYLVEIGGEILVRGENPQTHKPWIIGIDNPNSDLSQRSLISKIALRDKAMATSGSYRKFFTDSSARRYTHIINPKTGWPQKSNILSSTIVAEDCIYADAFATATMLMPLEAVKILAERCNFEYYIICSDSIGDLKTTMSLGFKELLR